LTPKPNSSSNARDGVIAAKLRYQRLSKSTTTLRTAATSTTTATSDSGHHQQQQQHQQQQLQQLYKFNIPSFYAVRKQQFKRDSAIIQMEKRAKAVADRAIVVSLCVICITI